MKNMNKKDVKKNNNITISFLIIGIFAVIPIILGNSLPPYRYVNATPFPLWYLALGIGVIFGILTFIILKKSGTEIKTCIGMLLVVCFMSFCISGVSFAHLNHTLDDSESIRYTTTIEKKKRLSGGRRVINTYKFTVTINESTFEIEVPSDHYYKFDEGDSYTIEYHNGAFNEPYYIGVGDIDNTIQ